MPELIKNGETGFLVKNVEEAAEAVNALKQINRAYCRQWAESKFSSEKMASDYFELYKKVLS